MKQELLHVHHTEDDQPHSTASSFVAKKPDPLHFASQLWKGPSGSARGQGVGRERQR